MENNLTFLCLTCYFKGDKFLRTIKEAGNTVYLVTKKSLENAAWPREYLDDIFYLDTDANTVENIRNLEQGLAHFMRSTKIDRVVSLDDFDVEKAAHLREVFRIPGMGQTTARYFRDKLAMRIQARDAGIPVPEFSPLFHDDDIRHFLRQVPGPWVVKPRSEASATGIKKCHSENELWPVLDNLGQDRYHYLIESFKPGAVFHSDALSLNGKVLFSRISQYLAPPFEVAHGGGVFRSATCDFGGPDDKALQELTQKVLDAFGMRSSASHTEFIKSNETGLYYFLETSSRVGGAHLSDMVEHSAGINLWEEWAKIENAVAKNLPYKLPKVKKDHAGILISLARQQHPDLSAFNAPEVAWKMNKENHVGFILQAAKHERVVSLLDQYLEIVAREHLASAPVPDHPMD